MKELTYEINHDDLICYFKDESPKKRLDNFNNGIELFRKTQFSEMKLSETAKYIQITPKQYIKQKIYIGRERKCI